MQELIDVIRAAIATDATTDQKAMGVQACRTIATALDTEPGKPLTLPGRPSAQVNTRVPVDQLLDLMIARLSLVAKDRETAEPSPSSTEAAPATSLPMPPRAPTSRGLRVPLATGRGLIGATRPTNARPVPPRAATAARPIARRKP